MTMSLPRKQFGIRPAADQEPRSFPTADKGAIQIGPESVAPQPAPHPYAPFDSDGGYLMGSRSGATGAPQGASYICQRPSAHGDDETGPKRGFTTNEAGKYIGRSSSWMRKKRLRGAGDLSDPGPKYIETPSGTMMYLREDLDAYLDGLAARAVKAGGGK